MFVKRVSCKMIAENVREDCLRCFCSLYKSLSFTGGALICAEGADNTA